MDILAGGIIQLTIVLSQSHITFQSFPSILSRDYALWAIQGYLLQIEIGNVR